MAFYSFIIHSYAAEKHHFLINFKWDNYQNDEHVKNAGTKNVCCNNNNNIQLHWIPLDFPIFTQQFAFYVVTTHLQRSEDTIWDVSQGIFSNELHQRLHSATSHAPRAINY